MIKVTIDTNVYLAALAKSNGVCAQLFRHKSFKNFTLVTSETILEELIAVGSRDYWRKFFTIQHLQNFTELITKEAVILKKDEINEATAGLDENEFPDTKDIHVFVTFDLSSSDYLVTGNKKDLLIVPKKKLLSPREFLKILSK